MKGLFLKLVRDLAAARGQFVAIASIAAIGVASFHGLLVAYLNQRDGYALSYERLAFADVSVAVRRAPRFLTEQIARWPGVLAAEGRIVEDVEVEQSPGRRPRVLGRIITVPAGRAPTVNQYTVLEGRGLSGTGRRELLLEASFAQANRYRPGDRLFLRLSGRRVAFSVAGIAASPEYIYPVASRQYALPMPETFGALFVGREQAEALLGMSGSLTEIALRTAPGQAEAIGRQVERRLRAYGPERPMLQAEQPSNKLLQSDLEGNRPMLVVLPGLFLGAAALAIGLVLARWVQSQRGLIGFLRAAGFSPRAILLHYLAIGATVGLTGGIVGVVLGHGLGLWISGIYAQFMKMPFASRSPHLEVGFLSLGLSVAACTLGALGPARRAARLLPAEAMRGQVPAGGSRRIGAGWPLTLALPLRNLLRRPLRTLGTASGVGSAVALMLIAGTFSDSMDVVLEQALGGSQRYDIRVAFVPVRSRAVLHEIARLPGVRRVEPTLEIPVRVRHGDQEKETVAMGTFPGARLEPVEDSRGRAQVPPEGAALLAPALAARLRLEPGDLLEIAYTRNTEERHAKARLRAGARAGQPIGFPVHLRLDELQRRFAAPLGMPPDAVGGALLQADPRALESIRKRLHRKEGVALVQTRAEVERQIETLTAFSRTFIALMYLIGAGMALAVAFTATDIVLWERTRELATLRTLGFPMSRLAWLVTLENAGIGAVGALLGIPPGRALAWYLIEASSTEGFTLEAVTRPGTYLLAMGGALAVSLLAQLPGLRRIARLDLAESIRLRDE